MLACRFFLCGHLLQEFCQICVSVTCVQSILVEFKSTAGQQIALYVLVSSAVSLLNLILLSACKQCLNYRVARLPDLFCHIPTFDGNVCTRESVPMMLCLYDYSHDMESCPRQLCPRCAGYFVSKIVVCMI